MLASAQYPPQQVVFGQQQQQQQPRRFSARNPELSNVNNNRLSESSTRNYRRATDFYQQDRFASLKPIPTTSAPANNNSNNEIFMRFDEDASEVINFVLTGGPKWGFRIRLLNDGRVIVSRVNKGPAEKCGLKANDELLSVNNVPLSNQPRSLLLHDYPEQQQLLQLQQTETSPDQNAGDKTPLLPDVAAPPGQQQQQQADKENTKTPADGESPAMHLAAHSVQLSKLDFAYQLIKHSSASNKLMLSVKRYINPAYARASVAATNFPDSLLPNGEANYADQESHLRHLEHHQQSTALAAAAASATTKRAHSVAGVHYAYKCCECYCDREGKF